MSSSKFSSSCVICTNVGCRGATNCGVYQTLNRRKLQLLKRVEEDSGLHLHFLDLSNLRLKSLPRDYFLGIGDLESFHLDLSGNDFTELPWWTFQHLQRCVKLDLHNCSRLTRVYEGLFAIQHALRGTLNLSNCPRLDLVWIDRLLLESTSWKHVNLSGCGIRKLHPKAFSRMDQLDDLDLSNNRLRSFALRSAKPRPTMWRLDLSKNPIMYVDAVVEDLQLDSCGLNTLEGLFSPAVKQHLEMLGATNNHLTEITAQEMAGFEALTVLGLSNNKIARVEEGAFTQGCPVLEDLYLNDNKLTEIPANFFKFQFIGSVLLQNNRLAMIHPKAFDSTAAHSVEINLKNNPQLALAPPPSLQSTSLNGGAQAIAALFGLHDSGAALEQYLEQLFEAQHILEMAKKQSIFEAFHEELMMRVLEPVRMERFVETHGMEAFMDVYA